MLTGVRFSFVEECVKEGVNWSGVIAWRWGKGVLLTTGVLANSFVGPSNYEKKVQTKTIH